MKKILLLIYFSALFIFAVPSDFTSFKKILIIDQGRVKPMDSFARSTLLSLSMRSSYKGEAAVSWLARLMFEPFSTADDNVFRVQNQELIDALSLPQQKGMRYSFRQIFGSFDALNRLAQAADARPEKERTALDQESLRVWFNLNTYYGISQALSMCWDDPSLMLSQPAAERLGLTAQSGYSLLDYYSINENVSAWMAVNGAKSDPVSKEISAAAERYAQTLENNGGGPLMIFPSKAHGALEWWSAWDVMRIGRSFASEKTAAITSSVLDLRTLSTAWNASDNAFETACAELVKKLDSALLEEKTLQRRSAEIFYNKLDTFTWAKILYLLGFLSALAALAWYANYLRTAAMIFLSAGLLYNLAGIALRMYISGRPPITNLFDTFIFVAATAAIGGILLNKFDKSGPGLIGGTFTAMVVMFVSGKWASDGDTMKVLVAVLDSNFWLSTHVVAVNLGYAGIVLSGVIAHYRLAVDYFTGDASVLKKNDSIIYGTQAFGLIFTFIGTVLGGIWADQSWGRFWGWDPKENGALMIVLWSAVMFHARLGGRITSRGFSFAAAFGVVVVMFAWFGINLLGIGLHSYGFTTGVAAALGTYLLIEAVYLIVFKILLNRKDFLKKSES